MLRNKEIYEGNIIILIKYFSKSTDYFDIFDDEINNLFTLHIEQCIRKIT